MIIVSIGEREIFPWLECESIFDHINDFLFIPIPSSTTSRAWANVHRTNSSYQSTLSNYVVAPTNSSIFVNVFTTHNLWVFSLSLARNLHLCSTYYILPLWKSLSRHSKLFWTLSHGSCLIASSFILLSFPFMSPYFCIIKVCNRFNLLVQGSTFWTTFLLSPSRWVLQFWRVCLHSNLPHQVCRI